MATTFFSLEEASGHLSWLESMFRRLDHVLRRAAHRRQEMAGLMLKGRRNGSASEEGEMTASQKELSARTEEARHLLEEIAAKGIIVRDPARGLVDFPHLRDNREVYLCWLRGEDAIRFWHETTTGLAGRQPL